MGSGKTAQAKAADFDGDGITDIAVFESQTGNWWIPCSSQGGRFMTQPRVIDWAWSADSVPIGGHKSE